MNARQRKKKGTQWVAKIGEEVEDRLYCGYCSKKLDLKRNKYAIKYGYCDSLCYGKDVGVYL